MRALNLFLALGALSSAAACSGDSSLGTDRSSLTENDPASEPEPSGQDEKPTEPVPEDSSDPGDPVPPTQVGGAPGEDDPVPPPPGTGGTSSGAGGSAPGPACEEVQCFRAIECVMECGGEVIQSSCCPCPEGSFDSIQCTNPPLDLDDLNKACAEEGEACPAGLTPTKYFGIAGASGPEFCSCSISCKDEDSVCPDGTLCANIADGPGLVCTKAEP